MESNTWETYTVISGVSLPDNPESMLLVTMVNSMAGTVTAIYFQVQQQSRNECAERWCNFYFWTDGESVCGWNPSYLLPIRETLVKTGALLWVLCKIKDVGQTLLLVHGEGTENSPGKGKLMGWGSQNGRWGRMSTWSPWTRPPSLGALLGPKVWPQQRKANHS